MKVQDPFFLTLCDFSLHIRWNISWFLFILKLFYCVVNQCWLLVFSTTFYHNLPSFFTVLLCTSILLFIFFVPSSTHRFYISIISLLSFFHLFSVFSFVSNVSYLFFRHLILIHNTLSILLSSSDTKLLIKWLTKLTN